MNFRFLAVFIQGPWYCCRERLWAPLSECRHVRGHNRVSPNKKCKFSLESRNSIKQSNNQTHKQQTTNNNKHKQNPKTGKPRSAARPLGIPRPRYRDNFDGFTALPRNLSSYYRATTGLTALPQFICSAGELSAIIIVNLNNLAYIPFSCWRSDCWSRHSTQDWSC